MGELNLKILEKNASDLKYSLAKLSILLGMDSFVYMITDSQNQVTTLKRFDFGQSITNPIELGRKIQPLLVQEELIKKDFETVKIGVSTPNFTLVPNALYREEKEKEALSAVTVVNDDDRVQVDHLDFFNSKIIYSLDKGVQYLLKLCFPNCEIFHLFTPFLNTIQRHILKGNKGGNTLFVNVGSNELQVVLLEDSAIKIINTYSFSSEEDFMYYVFLVFNQFNLSPYSTEIYLSGMIQQEHSRYRAINARVNVVQFVDWPQTLLTGEQFNATGNKHQFIDLAGLIYC